MDARRVLSYLTEEVRKDRREFKKNASTWDYVREAAKSVVALAILTRVLTQTAVARALGIGPTDDDISWRVFDSPIAGVPAHAEATGRVLQAVLAAAASVGVYGASSASPAVLALLVLNAGVLVADPVIMLTDKLQHHATR